MLAREDDVGHYDPVDTDDGALFRDRADAGAQLSRALLARRSRALPAGGSRGC